MSSGGPGGLATRLRVVGHGRSFGASLATTNFVPHRLQSAVRPTISLATLYEVLQFGLGQSTLTSIAAVPRRGTDHRPSRAGLIVPRSPPPGKGRADSIRRMAKCR